MTKLTKYLADVIPAYYELYIRSGAITAVGTVPWIRCYPSEDMFFRLHLLRIGTYYPSERSKRGFRRPLGNSRRIGCLFAPASERNGRPDLLERVENQPFTWVSESLIAAVKKAYPRFPLIVLTNGSLLWDPEVRRCLLKADRVVPSLDAVTASVFRNINRPHPSLEPEQITEGIRAFRKEYKGGLHLEIALVSGVNDNPEELSALAQVVESIRPDRVELNTVVRPPAHAGTQGLTNEQMVWAAGFFSSLKTEIVGVFASEAKDCGDEQIGPRIVETVERRPCTTSELAASLGVSEKTVELESKRLQEQGKLRTLSFGGKLFLCPAK